ncbi:MAG: acetyl-CoA carboxylase carboxyl transferase subunit alpha, partial [Acidobacteria bacterium 37-65-4]
MAIDTLEFEEPVAVLLKEIEAMALMPQTDERLASIAQLEDRVKEMRGEIFKALTPWQRVLVARHPNRPCMLDYVPRLFTDFIELHGDRRFADDHAIVTGMGQFCGQPVFVIGHQKGRDTQQKIYRNFGYARPEGYRKALRVMKLAEKFKRPVIVFVDTPAAYPGAESEERGVAEAIVVNLREMALLDTPIVVLISGEGGSGGAL